MIHKFAYSIHYCIQKHGSCLKCSTLLVSDISWDCSSLFLIAITLLRCLSSRRVKNGYAAFSIQYFIYLIS